MAYGPVTVFGGTRFLGHRIVERLGAAGARVRVAVRHTTEGVPPQGGDVGVVYADVCDGNGLLVGEDDMTNIGRLCNRNRGIRQVYGAITVFFNQARCASAAQAARNWNVAVSR